MTTSERKMLAAGAMVGLAVGLMIALFIAMKPEVFAALVQ